MATPPPCRDVILLGAGASIAGGLPTAAGFTRHLRGDVLVQHMATLGLARSEFLESITVIDPQAEEVIGRIQQSFSAAFNGRIRWIAHNRRFDEETPKWATRDVFRGVAAAAS